MHTINLKGDSVIDTSISHGDTTPNPTEYLLSVHWVSAECNQVTLENRLALVTWQTFDGIGDLVKTHRKHSG